MPKAVTADNIPDELAPKSKRRPAIPDTLAPLAVPIAGLRSYSRNPRQGDVGAIVESLKHHGQYRPIVVNARTSEVLAGNHTLRAARELGWTEIAATFVDVDEDQAARIVLVDNRSNDLATYDDNELADLLQSLEGEFEGTGYIGDDLDDLLASLRKLELTTTGDTEPGDVPDEPRTKPGDLYLLGEHRLLCGDSTDALAVERLMDGKRASAMWTDPPYGVSYVGKTADALTIKNDGADGLADLLREAFSMADTALEPGAAFYIAHPPGALCVTFGQAILDQGWRLHQTLIWVKDSMVLGHSDYHFKHEPIYFGYKPGEGRFGRGGQGWHGDDSQVSVLEFARPKRSAEHPTSKPIDLIEHCLGNSTRTADLLYEPFCGSGSTLIAAENLGRRCYAMELDPGYCDVIVDRWERHTGKAARLEHKAKQNGETP